MTRDQEREGSLLSLSLRYVFQWHHMQLDTLNKRELQRQVDNDVANVNRSISNYVQNGHLLALMRERLPRQRRAMPPRVN